MDDSESSPDTVKFNILDWIEVDETETTKRTEKGKEKVINSNVYRIKLFGRTEEGKSVYLRVEKYEPYFFVLLPDGWDSTQVRQFVEWMNAQFPYFKCIKHDIVDMKNFLGFRAGGTQKFIRFFFSKKAAMTKWGYYFQRQNVNVSYLGLSNYKFQVFESNLDPMLRMMHLKDAKPCGWIEVEPKHLEDITDEETSCNLNYSCNWRNIKALDQSNLAKFKILSYDLECTSCDGMFPQPERPDDKIIQIGMVFSRYGEAEPYRKIIITLGTCDPIEGSEVYACEDERQVLRKYVQLTQEEDPDVRCGYNIFGFDEMYVRKRSQLLGIESIVAMQSKFTDKPAQYVEKTLSSAGLGDNMLKFYATPGVVQIDLLKVVQRDEKLDSYKLDSVAETFFKGLLTNIVVDESMLTANAKDIHLLRVGNYIRIENAGEKQLPKHKIVAIEGNKIVVRLSEKVELDLTKETKWCMVKDDIKPSDIFEKQEQGPAERKQIAEYCIQDCVLVSRLMHKLQVITKNVCLANVSYVPLSYIFLRGQGIKCYSLVARTARQSKFCIPVMRSLGGEEEEEATYEGATVFEPDIGFHRTPIPVLDYNSLYPSSIIERNISHEMIVLDDKYDNLDGYEYVNVHVRGDNPATYRYAQPKDGSKGVVPTLLQDLLKERKRVKKLMEAEEDPFQEMIYDGLQLALKVTANSVYGQLGSSVGPLGYKPLAASTTATGRERLEGARDFVETKLRGICTAVYEAATENNQEKLNALYDQYLANKAVKDQVTDYVRAVFKEHDIAPHVIYGDSVPGYEVTKMRDSSNNILSVRFVEIATLFGEDKWIPCVEEGRQTKEACELTGVEVMTDEGFKPVKRIIRHTLAEHKYIVRVGTGQGSVHVTNDHSILLKDGTVIKPSELTLGMELMHVNMWGDCTVKNITNVGWQKGYVYDLTTENNHFQAGVGGIIVHNTDSIFCNMGIFRKSDSQVETDKKVLELAIKVGNLASWFIKKILPNPHNLEYEKTFYPLLLVRKKGYYGNKYENDPKKYKVISMGIVLKRRDNAPIVKKIIGRLLEIMVNEIDIDKAIAFLRESLYKLLAGEFPMEDFITTKTLKASYKDASKLDSGQIKYKLEYDYDEANEKGYVVKKKGTAFYWLNDTSKEVVFGDGVREEARAIIESQIRPQKDGTIKLIGAKKASETFSWDDAGLSGKMAHVALAKRMKERDPGNAPQTNDRIPFAFVEMKQERGKKVLQADKVEHPDFIREQSLKIDYLHYLTNQIMEPAAQFLGLVMKPEEVKQFFGDIINPIKDARKKTMLEEEKARKLALGIPETVKKPRTTKKSMADEKAPIPDEPMDRAKRPTRSRKKKAEEAPVVVQLDANGAGPSSAGNLGNQGAAPVPVEEAKPKRPRKTATQKKKVTEPVTEESS